MQNSDTLLPDYSNNRQLFNWEYLNDASCQRTEPEPWNESHKRMIAGNEAWALGVGISIFSIALIIAVWIMSCDTDNQKQRRRERESRLGTTAAAAAATVANNGGGQYGSLLPDGTTTTAAAATEQGNEREILLQPSSRAIIENGNSAQVYNHGLQQQQPPPLKRKINCCSLSCVLLFVPILLGTAAGFATIYYPQSPIVNLCSDEVDWVDSLKSLMTDGSIHTSFRTLFSVYNPNRYEAYFLNAVGTVQTVEGMQIGFVSMPDLYIPSFSIMDVMTNTTFKVDDDWAALELMAKYYRGTLSLVFRIEMELGVGSGHGWMRWTKVPLVWTSDNMHITSAGIEYMGNKPPYQEGDRHLCKCPS